jgi:hypothetical protein
MIEEDFVSQKRMVNKSVRYSRAGDEFHYRWAARRCLKLIYPNSSLQYIVVEGSDVEERGFAGEYVIDVTEYSNSLNNAPKQITYYQLKHTTARKNDPFNLSDLKNTIEGFAARYSDHFCKNEPSDNPPLVTFTVVTNRPISQNLKQNFTTICSGERVLRQDQQDSQFQKTIEEYTQLRGEHLVAFCASLDFADGEGDYNLQREDLRTELSFILAGTVDDPQITNIVELVRAKVMPDSDGRIVREEVLQRLGVTSERELFPAPPELEELTYAIRREQHHLLLQNILNASVPVIIHASGGVGKSVVARQVANSLPNGSLAIVYDCFGGGKYRNRSQLRHRHRDAFVQIANELASYGLCAPLVVGSALEDQIMQQFLSRIHTATLTLRQANRNAILAIFIDAADNAEMAAQEYSQSCFAHELLRETVPENCKLVMLCRTERIHLLKPAPSIIRVLLEPFTRSETAALLRRYIPDVSEDDALEFHRLTSGNPRVQANALENRSNRISQILDSLGPLGTTVEAQIAAQLDSAIAAVKDKFPDDYQKHIEAICIGLASLPPFVPLTILAAVADVNENAVKSFVSDIGCSLWLSDTSVQFRDEPTETWFREMFSANVEQISSFITRLKPLAQVYPYVAEALPPLLLQAEQYEDLVNLALSDELLPDNPIDERNVRVYRLQFAFKAALRLDRYDDAIKLAMRAGEEVAGDKRQLAILSKNTDLIAPLQSIERVQELAFRQLLRGEWDGSGNTYSAALLSSVGDFRGEARGYLRAANNWLRLYFEERDKTKDKHQQEKLQDADLVELTFAYYNLQGTAEAVNFLLRWQPPEVVYRLASQFIRKLIDAGDFDAIDEISQLGSNNQYLMLAIAHELLEVGRFPIADSMQHCLVLLTTKRTRIPIPRYSYDDTIPSAIVAFTEACAIRKLPNAQILRVLRHYFPLRASRSVSSNYQEREREIYLRVVALRSLLSNNPQPDLDDLLPTDWVENKRGYENDIREFKEVIGGLLPWYTLRAQLLVRERGNPLETLRDVTQRSKSAQANRGRESGNLPYEISRVCVQILTLFSGADLNHANGFFAERLEDNRQIRIQDRLIAVRAAFRSDHLVEIRKRLEQSAFNVVLSASSEHPETRAGWYIDLARAVLPIDRDDAAAYFDNAIEVISKFGDEIVERWEAVVAIANRTAEGEEVSPEMAYRFIRCAELIGDNVAREKYFDRDGAIKTCTRLSPSSGIAALSRWRDRNVGWFYRQLSVLAFEVLNSNAVSPVTNWSLSAFFDGGGLSDFASLCIEKEQSAMLQQLILDTAVRDLRLTEATASSWQKLKETAQKHPIDSEELDHILDFYASRPEDENTAIHSANGQRNYIDKSEQPNWRILLDGLELTSNSGLSEAIKRFDEASISFRNHKAFWQEIYGRIDEKNAVSFMQALIDAENVDRYNLESAISQMPNNWRNKASVRRNWDNFLRSVGRRFSTELTHRSTLQYFLEGTGIEDSSIPVIRQGILDGLSNYSDLLDASTFFGFAKVSSTLVSPEQASELLDYILSRFELHIDDEYADGNWADWLTPADSIIMTFAGFVWAALGSPRSEIRWRAAHCVRRLAKANCVPEIDALVRWMEYDEVGAFGSHKFPFYNLHARLYLLIALARVSVNNSQIIKHHHYAFTHHALNNMDHVLIQKFSAEIALNIEKAFPGTYSSNVIEQLHKIGISQLPARQTERTYENSLTSPWHEREEVNSDLKFLYGWDFGRYWFEPLSRVFGISRKQVEDLATEVIINKWQVNNDGSYLADPRSEIWQMQHSERETWHDHGSYPRSDNLSFYLSYHSLFVVASRLLQHMPVVAHNRDWEEDKWQAWLHRHMLTRSDGYWLSDRRDPAPLVRRAWFYQKKSENWRWEITPADFLDGLLVERNEETWLNVYGWWGDGDSDREESFVISTALVSPLASDSLLNALTACPPRDFKLPEYEEEHMEIDAHRFELKGWIWHEDTYVRLDEFDPHAGTIPYPPYQIGASIVKTLQMSVGIDLRKWYLPESGGASVISELWGTEKISHDEDPLRQGRRLSASLIFLKNLCTVLDCKLIIKVQVERRFRQKKYSSSEEGNEYAPPYSKIYLLSADGKLRDTKTCFQLREKPG